MSRSIVLFVLLVVVTPSSASAQTRVTSPNNKHNLSTSGPGPVKSDATTEICVF